MFVYNVSIRLEPGIEPEWVQWMRNVHIPDVLATGLFSGHQFFELLEPSEDEGKHYIVQYFLEQEQQYHEYLHTFAPELRQKAFDRFGDRFIAFRSFMKKYD